MSWLDSGLKVDTIVGHSFGQLTAQVIAGALSVTDGIRFVAERARLIHSSWDHETEAMLPALAVNGQQTIVLTGDPATISTVEELANAEGFSRRLKTMRLTNTYGFHSRLVEDIIPELRSVTATLTFREPTITGAESLMPKQLCNPAANQCIITMPSKILHLD
ncbi:hypothetical protein S7711_10244 [Stachybotrys chartarum IBT 7711]|uniref:Malonyl-CoA:ACP transacylase (MAT) domain-containing protein n=1 Tax=Stachybotrys chartarum (strain CBS 109288 / IBT 7711) TaxID=1280523 RepID=A0A084AUV3_STACB|nr:hypothetical protein S7711_10244 [Stachybotrys chartarum IBT 7711]